MPRYSAVLTNYNHSRFLAEAIANIRAQTIPFDEVLLYDDGSTDDSVAVIERLIADMPQARLIRNPQNMGVVPTLNRGLNEATGDFIFYMAADDRYSNRLIEISHSALALAPDAAMISGHARIHDTIHDTLAIRKLPLLPGRYGKETVSHWAKKTYFTFFGGANMIRRDALLALGGQHTELKWHADWFLYLILALRHPFAVVTEELVTIRIAEEQYSYAFNDWNRQRPVIEAFITLLKRQYPEEYIFFREHAILPSYDLQALPLFLFKPRFRDYVTPLLLWRLLTYKPFRVVGRLFPPVLRQRLRQWVRI